LNQAQTSGNRLGYTGQLRDAETGLMPLGNGERYYSSELGRFIQQDSVFGKPEFPLSMNRYAYVQNNPLGYTDPTGNAGVVADWLKQHASSEKRGWWTNFATNLVAGLAYDALNFASGFTLGTSDVIAQQIQRGNTDLGSIGKAVLSQGYASNNNPNAS